MHCMRGGGPRQETEREKESFCGWFKQSRTSRAAGLLPLLRGLKATKCIWVNQNTVPICSKRQCAEKLRKNTHPQVPPRDAQQNTTYRPASRTLATASPTSSWIHAQAQTQCGAVCTELHLAQVNEPRPRASSPKVIKAQPLARGRTKFKNKNGKRQPNTPSSTPRCPPGSTQKSPRWQHRATCCRRYLSLTYFQRPGAGRTRSPSSHKPKQ